MRYVLNLDDLSNKNKLWWNNNEYLEAEKSARSELKDLISKHSKMTFKDAKILLYQPNNLERYYPSFFTDC